MTDYKALYEAQVEENEDTLASLNFYQEANKELKEERKKLKEEHNKFDEIWKTEGITQQDIIDMKRQISN